MIRTVTSKCQITKVCKCVAIYCVMRYNKVLITTFQKRSPKNAEAVLWSAHTGSRIVEGCKKDCLICQTWKVEKEREDREVDTLTMTWHRTAVRKKLLLPLSAVQQTGWNWYLQLIITLPAQQNFKKCSVVRHFATMAERHNWNSIQILWVW